MRQYTLRRTQAILVATPDDWLVSKPHSMFENEGKYPTQFVHLWRNFGCASLEQGTLKEVVIAKANTGPSSQRYLARLTLMFAD
jgi:hypothetical protein